MARLNMVCSYCGSDDIIADANASWNPATQTWQVEGVMDKGHACNTCGRECKIDEVEIEGGTYASDRQASITIPEDAWEETGAYLDDDRARLLTTIEINGTPMHLEAYQVIYDEGEEARLVDADVDDHLGPIVGDGGFPLRPTEIKGREYVLLATPYAD